jgi:DegV family protein with EDD domain
MPQVGILTDSTAQFPTPFYSGNDLVSVLPMRVQLNGQTYTEGEDITIKNLPPSANDGLYPKVLPPSTGSFRRAIVRLEHKYQDIFILLISTQLNPATTNAHKAVASIRTSARVHIIDSQTTATGLGLQVQAAAQAAKKGCSYLEITHILRRLITHTYTVFCLQSLTYLSHSGLLDPAQALVGEMMDLTPIFTLDYGRLRPIHKARSPRNIFDTFHEFATEIGNLNHIALLKGLPPIFNEVYSLRERIRGDFPNTPYSEHTLGASLATILGPMTLGLVAVEHQAEDQ